MRSENEINVRINLLEKQIEKIDSLIVEHKHLDGLKDMRRIMYRELETLEWIKGID